MSALKVITIIKTILILVHCHCCSYSLPIENSQRPPNCYYFGPGITIPGADYRRDYGLSRIDCAEICKFDPCCMAFEWKKKLGVCTLKSRSLNGTITKVEGEVFFGLCLDHDDDERDRFWDHELVGHSIASSPKIDRIKCEDFCRSLKYGDEYRKKQRKNTSDKSDEVKTHMNIREHQKKESHNAAKSLNFNTHNYYVGKLNFRFGRARR